MLYSDGELSLVFVVVLCLILVGCAAGLEDNPTAAGVPTVDGMPTVAVPTETAGPQITDVADTSSYPTPTKTPKPTIPPTVPSTKVPDRPLNPEGPWLLFTAYVTPPDEQYLYAVNDDGTGLTQLTSEYVSSYEVQPGSSLEEGVTIAYITQSGFEAIDLTLKLLKLPGGEVQTITPLLLDDGSEAAVMLGNELRYLSGLAWSPDGRRLAFTGGMDGESVDVYAYDSITGQITRLTDGPLQAYYLRWSPGGQFVLHDADETAWCMGCPQAEAIFAARADGLGAIPLITLPKKSYGSMQIHGWLNSKELVVSSQYYSFEDETYGAVAQIVNLETGETTLILSGPYNDAAYSMTGDVWLLQPVDDKSRLLLYSNGREQEIVFEEEIYDLWWSETYDTFFAETEGKLLFTINYLGEVTEVSIHPDEGEPLPSAHGVWVSPDGEWWIWGQYRFEDPLYMWIGPPMAAPSRIQPSRGDFTIGAMIWSLDGQRLYFTEFPDRLWYVAPPDFEPVLIFSGLTYIARFTWIS